MRRPTSITVISWYLIVSAGIAIPGSLSTAATADGRQAMAAASSLPLPVQLVMLFAGLLMSVVCGIAMLKGKNWSRFVYLGWSGVGVVIGLLTFPPVAMLPGAIPLVLAACFLFLPRANQYFTSSLAGDEPMPAGNEVPGPSVASIVLYAIAGLLCMAAGLVAFFNVEAVPNAGVGAKACAVTVFLMPAVIAMSFGLAASGFRNWKRDAGVVLVSSSAVTAYCVLTLACAYAARQSQPTLASMPPNSLTDYAVGGAFVVTFALLGLLLIKANAQTPAPSPLPTAD